MHPTIRCPRLAAIAVAAALTAALLATGPRMAGAADDKSLDALAGPSSSRFT
jgi:hypothetical protein